MATQIKTSAYILTVAIPLKTQHPYFLNTDSLRKGQLKDLKCYAKLRYSKMSDILNSGKIIPTKGTELQGRSIMPSSTEPVALEKVLLRYPKSDPHSSLLQVCLGKTITFLRNHNLQLHPPSAAS